MLHDENDSHAIRRVVNLLILFAVIGFTVGSSLVMREYYRINQSSLETRFYPPTEDWTFREWGAEADGRTSAEVYYFKARPECLFVPTQIITVTFVTPDGVIGESTVEFIGDDTEGNTRPGGWQRLDYRVAFNNRLIVPGTILRGDFLHQCHSGLPTVSGYTNIVVGVQMPWPDYVAEWIRSGNVGLPRDYR